MPDKRIPYISFLQIIGPAFVILGHSVNGLDIGGAWYAFSKEWIYVFHMPLFFLISGYLLKFKENTAKYSYKSFIISKAKRLLLPYAFWNLLFLIPKILLDIPNSTQTVAKKALKALVYPRQNICGYTWFFLHCFWLMPYRLLLKPYSIKGQS